MQKKKKKKSRKYYIIIRTKIKLVDFSKNLKCKWKNGYSCYLLEAQNKPSLNEHESRKEFDN